MLRVSVILLAGLQATCAAGTSDLVRARMMKPRKSSGLLAETKHEVFESISQYMVKGGHRVAPCEAFTHEQLDDITEKVLTHRDEELVRIYKATKDKRGYVNTEGTSRDGKCAQILMLWAHHIPTEARDTLNKEGVTLPLMPAGGPIETDDEVYNLQASCTSCHYAKYDSPSGTVRATNDSGAPRWGGNNQTRQYSVLVNMTDISDSPAHPTWQFKYYYDDEVKASRYEHLAGQDDEVCRGATPTLKPCTVIFATNGFTYVQSESICCIRNRGSWGAVKSNWLQNGGGTYVGRTTVRGYTVDEWFKQGASDNHYYAMANDFRTPVRYMEHKNGKLKQWDFNVPTWKPGPQASSLFTPPENCDKSCP
eukprot:TRINITY_DN2012_c1_g1_i2.p1 TRINITY_DN2012_c1_g1~~TRINITY_DN2012_c1_g1_i2.p1  ORF type:complete len:387 (+),score=112.28 TRINITY_DN2012_c1_g1_i2:65-1162(+)